MIQRVQSIYLFICGAIIISLFFPVLYTVSVVNPSEAYSATLIRLIQTDLKGIETSHQMFYFSAILSVITVLGSLVVIFFYKKRQIQILLCRLLMLTWSGVLVAFFMQIPRFSADQAANFDYKATLLLMAVPYILIILATKAIQKDENLVRSTDRFRN